MNELLYTKNNQDWSKKQLKFPIVYSKKEMTDIVDD